MKTGLSSLMAAVALAVASFAQGQTSWNPKTNAEILWQTNVGLGYSMTVPYGDNLIVTGHKDEQDTIYCISAATGEQQWRFDYPQPLGDLYFQGGTTGSVTIDGDRLYHVAREGELFCLNANTGEKIWDINLKDTYTKKPEWGFTGSPIPYGDNLLIAAGEAGTLISKKDGSIIWKSKDVEHGYSTPYLFELDGRDLVIFSSKQHYICVDPKTGEEIWRHKWMTRYSVNASTPIVTDNHVFISSGYDKGAVLLSWDGKSQPERVWQSREMRNQMNPSLLLGDHLYGIDGNERKDRTGLKCIKFLTGEVTWSVDDLGHGAVIEKDNHLIVISEAGKLQIAPVSPTEFKPVLEKQIYDGKTWTLPVLSNGVLYCRNDAGEIAAVNLK
ncbi:MAG: PQQ-binding-like beta-propeller repeat protein [Verrucomicrobiota bacterium]